VLRQLYIRSRHLYNLGSSVIVVSDYILDDRCSISAEAKDFSSNLCVQTSSGAHPASYPTGTGGPFPGGEARRGRDADHSPHLVPRSRMSRSYTSSPTWPLRGGSRTALHLLFTRHICNLNLERVTAVLSKTSRDFLKSSQEKA
jgi:hypothetical protein